MEKVNKKYWIIGIVTTLIIAVTATTFAYWRGSISGVGEKMSMNFGQVYVLFTDKTSLTGEGEIKPGWNVSKTFTIENQGGKDFKYDIYIEDLINTFVIDGGLQYKITSDNNGYNMDDFEDVPRSSTQSDMILAEGVTVGAKVKQTYTIEFKYNELGIDQSEDMNRNFSGVLSIKENNSKTLYSTLTNGSVYEVGERTDFSTPFGGTTIQDGYNQTGKIYKVDNDYYFAGNPSDNWVKFADKWWRIIRTNSTEGTRLLYAGTSHDGQDGYISGTNIGSEGNYQWNSNHTTLENNFWSKSSFSGSSGALEQWYRSNIIGINDSVVKAIEYCNDTSEPSRTNYYGAYTRLVDAKNPSHACGTNSFGIAAKVGLMTADEVAYAGGVYAKNTPNTYYYRNSKSVCTTGGIDSCSVTGNNNWWTLSPHYFSDTANVFIVYGASNFGQLNYTGVNNSQVVRPVITLKASVNASGSGTTDDPYIITSDGSMTKLQVKVSSNDENMGTVSPASQKVSFGGDASVTLNSKEGYYYNSNTCGGIVENNVMTIKNVTDNKECKVSFGELNTLYATLKSYNLGTRETFDRPFGASSANSNATITQGYNQENTIYQAGDDYYFAGNPSDSWVKFADKWWRIIRTNSTEGTRLLYAGTSASGKDGYINNTTYQWNSNYNQYYYVQWDSYASFKNTLTSWYSSNITGTNDSMVNSIVYCNDTSYTNQSSWGTNGRSYGAYNRLESAKNPSHSCGTNNFGAAVKVGMMTADEVAFAGGERGYNSPNTYYYRNSVASGCTGTTDDSCSVTGNNHWWTLSPCNFQDGSARVFSVLGATFPGQLGYTGVYYSYAVRPVVTLKPEVLVSGSGTTDDPFVPSL